MNTMVEPVLSNCTLHEARPMAIPVKVAIRARPLISTDRVHEMVCVNTFPYANEVVVGLQDCFIVDYALPMDSTQSQVFDAAIYPMVDSLLQGYDTSVITYGQSNSGKTYTMVGPGLHCASSETEYGIIPRVTREIFNRLMQIAGRQFQVKVTFVEICGDTMWDLLSSSQYQRDLMLMVNQNGSPVLVGAEQIDCQRISEVFNCLHVGMSNQQAGWTTMKPRSHTIFTLSLEQQWVADGMVHNMLSRAQFTELASSDHVHYSVDSAEKLYQQGGGLATMGNVVSSGDKVYEQDGGLAALGNVISMLGDPRWEYSSVPFNQSVLTTMLKDSFGGKSHTLLMCCVSPASLNYEETVSSIGFVVDARKINNYPTMNAYGSRSIEPIIPANSEGHFTDETCDVVESNDGSTNADTFGLEFAASQWLKLVANAEGLFAQLVDSQCLSAGEREQVERWLCLKQECEECVASDEGGSVKEFVGRALERIDELTESEEKTDISVDLRNSCDDGFETTSQLETESESDTDSQRPDFQDKLEDFIERFKLQTDRNVLEKKDTYQLEAAKGAADTVPQEESSGGFVPRIVVNRNCLGSRRKSIHPGSEMPDLFLHLNRAGAQLSNSNALSDSQSLVLEASPADQGLPDDTEEPQACGSDPTLAAGRDPEPEREQAKSPAAPYRELKQLSAWKEARQGQIRQVLVDLEEAHKRIEELQCTIQIKEQFIGDMNKNSDIRASAQQRFKRKRSKLEEEYYKTRTYLAHAKNDLQFAVQGNEITDGKQKTKKDIEKYKTLAMHYEKRMKDIEVIKQIAGDSARKVLELENSLQTSRRQMEKLQKQLKKEEDHKHSLEQELEADQRKIKELEEKYHLQTSKLNEKDPVKGVEGGRLRWIQEEEERVVTMRESTQRFQEQLLQQQSMLDQREAFLKEKLCQEKCKTKSIVEVSARISHLEQVLKEKSTDLERAEDIDEKEALRHEIRNLRQTRDCLVEQRCDLDEKFHKEKSLSTVEERKLLECDEAIEAIDAAIEYKNELICGRKGQGLDNSRVQREKGEELLLERLMKLSPMEMRTLLYKYFQKVIDLRESGRKMEFQLAELDAQAEHQAGRVHALSNALQQARCDAERRLVVLQKEHQEKLHLMLRHFAEESSHSSGADMDSEARQMRRENHSLRRRVHELETVLKSAHRVCSSRSVSPVTIPQQNLKQLQGPESLPTTKVTRQKNKLIIQQHKPKKYSKS